jgi:putative ABC transport system substrate-binding protein
MKKAAVTSILVAVVLLAVGVIAEAQQPKKLHRIGFLLGGPSSLYSARIDVFKQGLKELGWIEGKNIAIEYRSAEGRPDREPRLAAELVRLKVDIIVVAAGDATIQG